MNRAARGLAWALLLPSFSLGQYISLRPQVRLEGDELRWTARVENRAPVTIVDFSYPQVGGIDTHLRDYIREVSALRDRHWDLLGSGRFLDDRGLRNGNPSVTATVFARDNRRAVVLWNQTAKSQSVAVEMPGRRLREAAGTEGPLRAAPTTLNPQEIVVLVYE